MKLIEKNIDWTIVKKIQPNRLRENFKARKRAAQLSGINNSTFKLRSEYLLGKNFINPGLFNQIIERILPFLKQITKTNLGYKFQTKEE